jgi:anti-sigma regulatory factor (Ser/Thr protein kinase)
MNGDEISLTLPADEAFHRVAHLVLGGLAVRLDLTYERLEDLELAVDALLERHVETGDVTLVVRVLDGALQTSIGPLGSVREELQHGRGDAIDLGRILGTVCDRVEVVDRTGGQWVELTQRVENLGEVRQ